MFISKDKETSKLQASATQKIELYIAFSTVQFKNKSKISYSYKHENHSRFKNCHYLSKGYWNLVLEAMLNGDNYCFQPHTHTKNKKIKKRVVLLDQDFEVYFWHTKILIASWK